ncbi:protein C3orf33 homolog [Crassostrea virginica]
MRGADDDSPSSLLTTITKFLDSNVRLTRNLLYGIGFIGFVVAVKNSGLTHIITCASDIPGSFIARKVRVRGFVEAIGTRGIVHVQHRPVLNIVPIKWRPKSHVQLELALVDISPPGSKWLQDNISQKIIWFQPLSVSDSTVQANIFQWKYILPQSINVMLVGKGICKVKDLTSEQLTSMSLTEEKLLEQLLHQQMIASEKERGMWQIKDKETKGSIISSLKNSLASIAHFCRKVKRKITKK